MAMLLRPPLLLADEPTSALDVDARDQVLEELRRMRERYHTAMLLVSHDFSVVSALADRVLVLREGRMVECGSRQQVLFSPAETYTPVISASEAVVYVTLSAGMVVPVPESVVDRLP